MTGRFVKSVIKSFAIIFMQLTLFTQYALGQSALRKWQVFELDLKARKNYENPYTLVPAERDGGIVKAEFKGLDGAAAGKAVQVYGFWDGGQSWKIRFAAPATGNWEYKTMSADPGLNNRKGKLEVMDWTEAEKSANATRRGLIRVLQTGDQPGHFFQYADGTPVLWIGDTWWNWTERAIKFSTYAGLVDDRATKGFNVGQLFVAANGWSNSSCLLDETFSKLDVAHMKRVDSLIRYANEKGITVWVHGWWSRPELGNVAGEEKIRRWYRYLIDRLGAYNVVWVVAGEYNMNNYGGMGLEFWKNLGAFIKASDPYDRIVGIHPTPPFWDGGKDAPQWSTAEVLHDEKWLDYNQSQVGHGRWCNELIPDIVAEAYAKKPAKPIVVTEPWYEFVEGNPTAADIRFGLWSALLSGAAGHSYGGGHVWLAYVPEAPFKGGHEPLDRSFETTTYDYPGAVSMGLAAQFFKPIKFWEFSPHPELLVDYPDKYCTAIPGKEYLAYLRWGGVVKIDLRASLESESFEYRWFNPADGKFSDSKTIQGGDIRQFIAPESYPNQPQFKDWVIYLKKSEK